MKINQRFIVKLALGFVAMGGLLILVGFAMSGFSWDAYATDRQAWYRTFNVSSSHHEFGVMLDEDTAAEEAAEESAEKAEESRELAAEKEEEAAEAMSDLEETLAELRSEAQELQGVDAKKAAEVEALIKELEAALEN